jgi:glyoxylate reductase
LARPRVLVTRKIFPEYLEAIAAEADMELWEDELPPPRDVLLERSRGVEGILCLLTDGIDAEFMDNAGPQLKVISQIAVGFDNIEVPEATRRGIPVGNTPDVLTQATADATWALLLAAARRITEGERVVRDGRWETWHPLHLLGQDLHGATLGVIGMGRIGFEVAKRSVGFGMKVLYHDLLRRHDYELEVPMQQAELDRVLAESDFLTVHTVLNDSTYHLLDDAAFAKMKPNAIVVNAARGPVIDPKALYTALSTGKIAGAGLDVTEPEPIPNDDPLLTVENCVIVPHIASASRHTRREMSRIAATNLLNGLRGERLLTCVNPEVYD